MSGTITSAVNVVKQFWQLMATNDFHATTAILSEAYPAHANRQHLVEPIN